MIKVQDAIHVIEFATSLPFVDASRCYLCHCSPNCWIPSSSSSSSSSPLSSWSSQSSSSSQSSLSSLPLSSASCSWLPRRLAVWGWSFGGFLAAHLLSADSKYLKDHHYFYYQYQTASEMIFIEMVLVMMIKMSFVVKVDFCFGSIL